MNITSKAELLTIFSEKQKLRKLDMVRKRTDKVKENAITALKSSGSGHGIESIKKLHRRRVLQRLWLQPPLFTSRPL